MKVAVRYGDMVTLPRVKLGSGLVGYAALHKEAVLVPDVSADPRYIKIVEDARSELVIPLLVKDRCIGVFDLESPELDAFTKNHVEILTLLASQAAVAIENARLYEDDPRQRGAAREGNPVRAARPGGAAADGAAEADQGRRRRRPLRAGARARRRSLRLPHARAQQAGGRGRRRLGQRRAGGALQRVCRRAGAVADVPAPLRAGTVQPGRRAGLDEHDPPRAAARGVLLHAVLRGVRLQAADRRPGQLRPAVPDSLRRRPTDGAERPAQIELPGVPLGSFAGSTYDEVTFDLAPGDLFVFCTDGVSEAFDALGREFGAATAAGRRAGDRASGPRARSSTRSSRPFRNSAATRRRTTT